MKQYKKAQTPALIKKTVVNLVRCQLCPYQFENPINKNNRKSPIKVIPNPN